MGTQTCNHEIRSANLHSSKRERFEYIDQRIRDFDRTISSWPELAKMCEEVQREKLWKEGQFDSFEQWLRNAAPRSERGMQSFLSTFKSLKEDFTEEEMKQMRPETARVVKHLSKAARRNPKVREATREKREKFIETVIREHPGEHIEQNVTRTFTYEFSQWDKIHQAFELYRRIQNPNASEAEILECWAVDYLIENTQAMGAEA